MLKNQKILPLLAISALSAFACLLFPFHPAKALVTATSSPCTKESTFYLTLKNASGSFLSGMKFELYEQKADGNGLPSYGNKIGGGTADANGQGKITFKPDSLKSYVLKVWDKKADLGEFWFYDAARFVCSYDRYLTKEIPALSIVLRGNDGQLKKNYSFSLYAQNFDKDNKPYYDSNRLISAFKTDSAGQATVYVAPYNVYNKSQSGFYAIAFKDSSRNQAVVYGIAPYSSGDKVFEYRFSGLAANIKDAAAKAWAKKSVKLYEQLPEGNLGKVLYKAETDADGSFSFEYPAGTYALTVADSFKQDEIFHDITLSSGASEKKYLKMNLTRFVLTDAQGEDIPDRAGIEIYALVNDGSSYSRGKRVSSVVLSAGQTGEATIAAGKYLAFYKGKSGKEYGQAFEAIKGRSQTVKVIINSKYIVNDKAFKLAEIQSGTASASTSVKSAPSSSSNSLKGRILLQVESKGEAWYVNPVDGKRYYLGRPKDAFDLMKRFGLGVSNANFNALQANPSAYRSLAGRILIKVEDSGKAYYFDSSNLKLYSLGRPAEAFEVIRSRGLGISNANIDKISQGN